MVDIPRRIPAVSTPSDSAIRVRLRRMGELAGAVVSNPTTVIGILIIVAMLLMAVFAPLITEPSQPDPYQMPRDWAALNEPPGSSGYLLGTTNTGGDVFYGVVWGARTSLRLSLLVVGITSVVGVVIGSIAGFRGASSTRS